MRRLVPLIRLIRFALAGVASLLALLVAAFAWLGIPATGAGLAAKTACSGVFLAGRSSAYITGQSLFVDGGLSVH